MHPRILKALSIERGEESKVFLLLLQSFFLGVFIASYEVIASALFFNTFEGEEANEMASISIVISGIVGIILVSFYSWFQRKVRFSQLATINLLAVMIITFLLRLAFGFTDSRWLIFSLFLTIGPLAVITFLGFWGTAGRLFTLRQGKRLFGLVDSGLIIGMILVSSLTPVFQLIFVSVKDILYISGGSMIVAVVMQFVIKSRFGDEINNNADDNTVSKSSKITWKGLLGNKFTRTLTVFVVFSMVGAFFIWMSYLDVAKKNYPFEKDLTNFIGIFNAIVMVFALVIKTTLFSRIMKTYGLKITLISLAVLILLFTILSAVIGTAMGYDPSHSGFILYFLVICLTRLFSQSLKYAIENPAQKIFFQPLDKSIRYDAQAKIEGVVNEFSGSLAGGILIVIFAFLEVIHVTYLQIGIITCWLFAGIKLYKEYQNSLKASLASYRTDATAIKGEHEVVQILSKGIKNENAETAIYALKLTENIEPKLFEKSLQKLISDSSKDIRLHVLKKIKEHNLTNLRDEVEYLSKSEKDDEVRGFASFVAQELRVGEGKKYSNQEIIKTLKSRSAVEREFAVKLIATINKPGTNELLADVIRDAVPAIKFAVISAIARTREKSLYSFIIDNLTSEKYCRAATSALISLGDECIDPLNQAFYRSGYDTATLRHILAIMGIVGGVSAIENLKDKLTYPDQKVVSQALVSLKSCGYQADEEARNRILQIVSSYIGNISWYLAAENEIKEDSSDGRLAEAIAYEIDESYQVLYSLLALAYDPKSINNIRENIESGSLESISYAIELLDLFISEELKPKLFPLLEDIPRNDKINLLQIHFPRDRFNSTEVLYEILNKDSNFTNRWTKACALMSLADMKKATPNDTVVAQLFNEDILLQECAAVSLNKLDPAKYDAVSKRLDEKDRLRLLKKLKNFLDGKCTIVHDRILFLRTLSAFSELQGVLLAEIATRLTEVHLPDGKRLSISQYVGSGESPLIFVQSGKVRIHHGSTETSFYEAGTMIRELNFSLKDSVESGVYAQGQTHLFILSEDILHNLMYDFPGLIDAMIYSETPEPVEQDIIT